MSRCDCSFLVCVGTLLLLSVKFGVFANGEWATCSGIVPMSYRNDKISITDFGGVGDGVTSNTKAFREAIYRIEHLRRRGGTLLYVPPGEYLTGPFNLTSRMTLYLARGAVIKATTVSKSLSPSSPCEFCVSHYASIVCIRPFQFVKWCCAHVQMFILCRCSFCFY